MKNTQENKEIAVVKERKPVQTKNTAPSVESFIIEAIEQHLPVETMRELFNLQKEVRAEQAREAFTEALANFQSKCPVIEKTKKVMNKDGRTVRYKFAPIDSIVEQIKKPLAECGFSYTWSVKNAPGEITAVAKLTHKLGHSETSELTIPIDKEGFMTAPQKVASALTFAKRYTLCNILGISTGDEDTDANDVNKEPDVKSIKSKIVFLLNTLEEDTKTKENIEKAVLKLAKLKLEEKNFEEIKGRLEILVQDQNENSEI